MSETAIEAVGLRKRYGDDEAVAGVDLAVPRGEVLCLLGPNGAGKSTTVEILGGFRLRDGGTARVLGEDPGTAGRRWRSRLGVVWQGEALVPRLTVRAVVRHFAGYYPQPRDPDAVVEMVGLGERARARVTSLSGGQRRRLDVALGIVGRPELLFLDEPTTGFDPRARRDFWSLVGGLARGGTTVVLTTHHLEEAEALADRVCVIARGRVRALGSPSTLGGRASARATVGWTADGRRREVRTDEPTRLVGELTTLFSGEIPELSVHRPTLEEVYLDLIGDGHGGVPDSPDGRGARRAGTEATA
ncbi:MULTISPECIES: ABC transporter ATP-binding protein [Nocardiopsis]|uniref:ABC transporter n=1 Tax=Nocardiopsis sinuspersici TaxID=501010 RepID=A0A1V3BVQ4_9ACTN|nr:MULTISPECIES: ABC transporter ATP-binding protein [Nocardiopsis]NYH53787.1 ABC-2 type transport system ATP-binding protein [Nocardiopsis sinuspersici]OOC52714.1 ABC transporter [Nocardiopsis sinuspersici]